MIRVVIVDDHELVRDGLRALLDREPDIEVVGEAGDGQTALEVVRGTKPAVVLMDLSLPGGLGGLEATEVIHLEQPDARVVVLTQYHERAYVKRALRLGAWGYVLKSAGSDQVIGAIRTVAGGQRYLHPEVATALVDMMVQGEQLDEDEYERLTPRERQVFKLLAEGRTSREIGRELGISLKTAMSHRGNLMAKLNLHSRSELIHYAVRIGVLPLGLSPP